MKKKFFILIVSNIIPLSFAVAQDIKNMIYVEQVGNANVLEVEQNGNGNVLFLKQIGFDDFNEATVKQNGDRNEIYVVNSDKINNAPDNNLLKSEKPALSFLELHENYINIQQLGNDNSFRLEQYGNKNIVGIADKNAFAQDGDGNKFAGVTNEGGLAFDENGNAKQYDGAKLDMDSYQAGNDNTIGLRQGAGDVGLMQQFGNGNEALLWQGGGGQVATLLQIGSGNRVSATQN